jgi:hypothetical protein
MFELEEALLTEAPPYDWKMVDNVILKYCTVETVIQEKAVIRNVNGIVVTKRKNAILKSLYNPPRPIPVFGEIEFDALRATC